LKTSTVILSPVRAMTSSRLFMRPRLDAGAPTAARRHTR
jgi:hypothetical protein